MWICRHRILELTTSGRNPAIERSAGLWPLLINRAAGIAEVYAGAIRPFRQTTLAISDLDLQIAGILARRKVDHLMVAASGATIAGNRW